MQQTKTAEITADNGEETKREEDQYQTDKETPAEFFHGNVRRRVKVYQLDDDSQWEDKGTGQVNCDYIEVCFNTMTHC